MTPDFEAGRMWRAAAVMSRHACTFYCIPKVFARWWLLFLMSESNFQKRPVVHRNEGVFPQSS